MSMYPSLQELSKEKFYELKASGALYKMYPNAPQYYQEVRRSACTGQSCGVRERVHNSDTKGGQATKDKDS